MFNAVLPIYLLVVLGYILRRHNIIKAKWVTILNSFVYFVSLPALIIYSFTSYSWSESGVISLVGYNLLFLLIATTLVVLLLKTLPINKKDKAVILLAASVGNTVYLGIPLTNNVLGNQSGDLNGLVTAIGVVQLVGAMLFALIAFEYVFLGSKNFKFITRHILKNPLIIAVIIGIALSLFTWPNWLD